MASSRARGGLERGRVVRGGMGGFLNPPTHPEHELHVETDLRRRPENRGGMSLTAAAEAKWLDAATRAEARRILADWQPPSPDSPEVVDWRRQVLGYFRGMYRNPNAPSGQEWHAGSMIHDPDRDPIENADDHGGVNLIRHYYPDYMPTEEDFGGAYWGTRPSNGAAEAHRRGASLRPMRGGRRPLPPPRMRDYDDDPEGEPDYEDEPEPEDDFDLKAEMEDALVIQDARRGGYSLSFGGRYVDDFDDFDRALVAGVQMMHAQNYFPNIFYVNDHGNVELLRITKERKRKGKVVGVEYEYVRGWV